MPPSSVLNPEDGGATTQKTVGSLPDSSFHVILNITYMTKAKAGKVVPVLLFN
jgi:hypothetical protein